MKVWSRIRDKKDNAVGIQLKRSELETNIWYGCNKAARTRSETK
jgi:hypothetical protein